MQARTQSTIFTELNNLVEKDFKDDEKQRKENAPVIKALLKEFTDYIPETIHGLTEKSSFLGGILATLIKTFNRTYAEDLLQNEQYVEKLTLGYVLVDIAICRNGNEKLISLILDRGVTFSQHTYKACLARAEMYGHLNAIALLIKRRADLFVLCDDQFKARLPLQAADRNNIELAKEIQKAGTNINCVAGGKTALDVAISSNNTRSAKILIDLGAKTVDPATLTAYLEKEKQACSEEKSTALAKEETSVSLPIDKGSEKEDDQATTPSTSFKI